MANVDILAVFRSKQYDPLEFHFESLVIPNMYFYLTQQDIDALRYIATSARFASKIDKKYEEIDKIMRNRGFKRFSAGTNRVVYRHLEDNRFLAKIAVDKVGMQDNPLEYHNQDLLKPFVTKMFQISPCGTVGFAERVLPIKRKEEFREIASDVFDILVHKILGKYVVEDVGTKYFMNWGVRYGFGPVLLDYPYVYELDGNKLYCTGLDFSGCICNGEIDYDPGFNKLVCTRCGRKYLATDLRDNKSFIKINIKGGNEMKVKLMNNGVTVFESDGMDEFITKPKKPVTNKRNKEFGVRLLCNGIPVVAEEPKTEINHGPKPELKLDPEVIETSPIEESVSNTTDQLSEVVAYVTNQLNVDNVSEICNNGGDDSESIVNQKPVIHDNTDVVPSKMVEYIVPNNSKMAEYEVTPKTSIPVAEEDTIVYTCQDKTPSETTMSIALKRAGFMSNNEGNKNDNGGKKNHGKRGGNCVRVVRKNTIATS